ncbi:MAG: hypothetical protein Q9170_005499 [Blastenia crenularia]
MDPASILSLISTAGTIASAITGTIRNLSDLRATYTDSNVRIRLLIKELSTIKSSLTQINDWVHFLDDTHKQVVLKDALQVALDGVDLAKGALADEVRNLVQDASPRAQVELGFRAKTKSPLSIVAASCEMAEFLRAPQNRQIIQKVAEDTITLRNSMSVVGSQRGPPTIMSHDDSTNDDKVLDIDDEIVNAAMYRRALHHNTSKRNIGDNVVPQPRRGSVQIHAGSDDGRDNATPIPSPTPSKEFRPLPYENSVFSEPVDVYRPGAPTYIPFSSRSDGAPESRRPLAHRLRSSELGKKTFWSALAPKRSSRNVNSPTPTTSGPNTPSSSSAPGSHRGRRGFEDSSHASIDFGSENGLSAPSIVRAAQAGSVMEIEMALDQDPSVVEAVHQQSGRTALAVASHCGNIRVVQLLLQYDADVNTRDASSFSPLHLAAMRGHYDVVHALLQEHVKTDELGPNDETPLWIASEKSFFEVASLLLQTRAKVNARDKKRLRTPLHVAAINGDEATCDLLIRHGAHTEAKDGELMTALHYACEIGKDRIVSLLLNKKASPEALGRHVQLLLGYNANAEVESSGKRPLHTAAAKGLTPIATVLLNRGVDIESRDADGERALGLASRMGHLGIVRMLLDRGSRLRSKFAKGPSHEDSPLCLAARGGHIAVVRELVGRGASVLQKDEQNWPPLRYASHYAWPTVVDYLVKAGATISGNPSSGWGFDITARRIGFVDKVRQEVERKA